MREVPRWVQVWMWLRFLRQPPVRTPLPQQDDPDAMSLDAFELYEAEWLEAGSPSLTSEQFVAVMSGTTPEDDDEIPF
jgi:hypothetical protein